MMQAEEVSHELCLHRDLLVLLAPQCCHLGNRFTMSFNIHSRLDCRIGSGVA